MSAIDYTGIEQSIKDLLLSDERTREINGRALTVALEDAFQPIPDRCPWVGVYLDSWASAAEREFIGGAQPMLTTIVIELWLYEYSLENAVGAQKRDILLENIKEVLKANRTLSSSVLVTRFLGGEFDSAKVKEGFLKGVSLRLECEVRE